MDLRGRNLSGNLFEAYRNPDLTGADLTGADLSGADLSDLILTNAIFISANLRGANLRGAHLYGAHLNDAHLERANLRGANLRGAHLYGAHLNGAHLERAYLNDAHLEGAHLEGANLLLANLRGAHLEGAHLEGANLLLANLRGTHLEGAQLEEPPAPRVQPNTIRVNALQVHREASKINYEKLIDFLKDKLTVTIPNNINYAVFINDTIITLINQVDNTVETKVQQRNDFESIMRERLIEVDYSLKSGLVRESIFYSLNYVLNQPNTFKKMYLQTFIQDCIHAYEGENGMTCANGALERIVFSLVPACTTEEKNKEYETITAIITANPVVLIPIYILDWYKLHKSGTPNAFPPGTTEEQMKTDLKSVLLEKFPTENDLIDRMIVKYADSIGYDDESFMYGGKKRKTKKQTRTKISKTNKRKTKKSVSRK